MSQDVLESLTYKQRMVLDFVDKRRTYKQIAQEMGISEPRVGQYVRNLKNKFGVNDLAQLTDAYRDQLNSQPPPYSETTSCFIKVPQSDETDNSDVGHDESVFKFADSQSFEIETEWASDKNTQLVPEVLDGKQGTLKRVILMLGIAVTGLIILIASLAAMSTLSDIIANFV